VKLSPFQAKVLAQIVGDARISPQQVAKNLGKRSHSVRYAIQHLRSCLDLKPYCFTDPFKIGLFPYRALFSIDSGDQARCKAMTDYLRKRPEVSWFRELYGHFQFLLAIRVRSTQHLDSFLRDFDSLFGDMIVSRTLAQMSRTSCFTPWLAYTGRGTRSCVEYRHDSSQTSLDELDLRILGVLFDEPLASMDAISRALSTPSSTITYRVEKLVKAGVILGFMYGYDARLANAAEYLILVKLYGLGGGLHERFFEFARSHPRINRITRMIGDWDLELEVHLDNAHDINHVIHQLYQHGAGCVKEVLAHTWGVEHQTPNSTLRPSLPEAGLQRGARPRSL